MQTKKQNATKDKKRLKSASVIIKEIAIVDLSNTIIIDTVIYIKRRIDNDAFWMHKISELDLENMPKFREIESHISRLLEGRQLYIFNADFYICKMKRSASKDFEVKASSIDCLMSLSSRFLGTYHLISLANSCELVGVDHRALSVH